MLDSELAMAAAAAAGDASAALAVADAATALVFPTGPATTEPSARCVQELLSDLAEIDLTVARVVEPQLDALLILREAGVRIRPGRWGVYASEAPGLVLNAVRVDDGWRLDGVKEWCSLAGILDRALITARTDEGYRLFAVDLHHPGVSVGDPAGWAARGLTTVVSTAVEFSAVAAEPVGAVDWYLIRPGFGWGGIRVAACWYGGARAVYHHLRAALGTRSRPDPIRQVALGHAEVACWSAALALEHAAAEIDAGHACADAGAVLAARTRALVADAVETVLRDSGHALGAAPLAFDIDHARRVADLQLYVRQHHAERDLAALAALPRPGG
ncbi:acyl-CoA dehydrogenase family protein [Jatrophihabitans lederbergiae]|uniref:Acyl-CoA oxidase/dehydrogenase middle domain-containing protein n=1 Tax=Jatrophihabitans lederbergiae TaxID=3075547 RepID=A0ABU2JEI6_9ACTN|nr:acyl-CoA dehydrogenase family protein [Jatrophihabitans sp. DSM 44399]MDT0263397.1 hypothetical protein [Jatrophihabitans sp. DSM 44399]